MSEPDTDLDKLCLAFRILFRVASEQPLPDLSAKFGIPYDNDWGADGTVADGYEATLVITPTVSDEHEAWSEIYSWLKENAEELAGLDDFKAIEAQFLVTPEHYASFCYPVQIAELAAELDCLLGFSAIPYMNESGPAKPS